MKNIGIGTLLRNIRDNSTIYLITDETNEYFIATFVGDSSIYRRLFKDMNHDHFEVIG